MNTPMSSSRLDSRVASVTTVVVPAVLYSNFRQP